MTTAMKTWGPNENLTLTEAELSACRPIAAQGGKLIRAFCPIHGSDHQRSLQVNTETGRFHCHSCDAWGYMAEHRQQGPGSGRPGAAAVRLPWSPPSPKPPAPCREDLDELLPQYQAALPGSLGEEYLRRRGIPLELAQRYGVGYAARGCWKNPARDWKWGRVVFPLTDPAGRLLNFYGRAVGSNDKVPKADRHDKLPGDTGWFNTAALAQGSGPVGICEGSFDCLSLIAAGHPRTTALLGVHGWRWPWVRNVGALLFALDTDAAGQRVWRDLARQSALRGKAVAYLAPTAYGGHKDLNEAWMAGALIIARSESPTCMFSPCSGVPSSIDRWSGRWVCDAHEPRSQELAALLR